MWVATLWLTLFKVDLLSNTLTIGVGVKSSIFKSKSETRSPVKKKKTNNLDTSLPSRLSRVWVKCRGLSQTLQHFLAQASHTPTPLTYRSWGHCWNKYCLEVPVTPPHCLRMIRNKVQVIYRLSSSVFFPQDQTCSESPGFCLWMSWFWRRLFWLQVLLSCRQVGEFL